jgi:hypothetical protein
MESRQRNAAQWPMTSDSKGLLISEDNEIVARGLLSDKHCT